ncbi:unnamed protein product [Diatraea saccharalis]|uniref:Peptidase S1 domain-containing protein n=1 Tax=Diatraea saccharalis TaxID=40085 RepID=A0A9P0C800_9NEOP|nr:unnamed protein product [Diatraea saccharalis]
MKGFLVLFDDVITRESEMCVFPAARESSALGENPWVVHLRMAMSSGTTLNSCAGSLIGQRWVLTSISCITGRTFIWVRYGVVEVIRPSLVTETNAVQMNNELGLALININRNVEFTDVISAVGIAGSGAAVPASGKFCGFGASESGGPGENLACFNVNVEVQEDGTLVGQSDELTRFDLGGALVVDGVQYGVLVEAGDRNVFVNPAVAREWIEDVTGIDLDDDDDSSDGDDSSEENGDGDDDGVEEVDDGVVSDVRFVD